MPKLNPSDELSALLRARSSLIWIVSPEEKRVERAVIEAAGRAKLDVRLWDCVDGVRISDSARWDEGGPDIGATLAAIASSEKPAAWVLRDVGFWLKDPNVLRAMRNLARRLPSETKQRAIICIAPTKDLPPELADHAIVLDWPLPDRAEIGRILDNSLRGLPEDVRPNALAAEDRDAAIEAAVGLTAEGAATCYTKSLVTQGRRIVPAAVSAEKRRIVNQASGVEWFDPDPRGLDAIGGLDLLKKWLAGRTAGFSERARAFGLPTPKGLFLTGIPGCGKSLTAKATATAFGCPLLRADLGAAQSKWVGESQANIRKVFSVAETLGKCVLWIDEIEKALAGATAGAADGGVSADVLNVLLTWMQEKTAPVFVIATSNDVSKLPPELLRKGRFDELFFVDLPTAREREEILRVTLTKLPPQHAASVVEGDLDEVLSATNDFTGSEVAELVTTALHAAFDDGERAITTSDLLVAAKATVPLARTMPEKIDELRKWAKTRARRASSNATIEVVDADVRPLDI